jgi:hypothetical protein
MSTSQILKMKNVQGYKIRYLFVSRGLYFLKSDKIKYDYWRWASKFFFKVRKSQIRKFLCSFHFCKSAKVCIFGLADFSSLQITKRLCPQIKNSQSATFAEDPAKRTNYLSLQICRYHICGIYLRTAHL